MHLCWRQMQCPFFLCYNNWIWKISMNFFRLETAYKCRNQLCLILIIANKNVQICILSFLLFHIRDVNISSYFSPCSFKLPDLLYWVLLVGIKYYRNTVNSAWIFWRAIFQKTCLHIPSTCLLILLNWQLPYCQQNNLILHLVVSIMLLLLLLRNH